MEEMFDTYTRNGKYLGVKSKSICHSNNPGIYHKPVWIWIINNDNKILVQKRSKHKKSHPLKYDMPSAGHIKAGENPIDACVRETYEELGIKIAKEDFKFIQEYIYDKGYELAQVYLLKLNKEYKFNIDNKEVDSIKWLNINEFKKLFYSDEFVLHTKEYQQLIYELLKNKTQA